MYKAVHFKSGQIIPRTSEYIRRHDVVYQSPAYRPCDGLPVGSGFFGGLFWHTNRSIEMSLNHTDAVDFGPDGVFKAWAWEAEEVNTAPFSLGRLSIGSPCPTFDWVYLDEFEDRLNLAGAHLTGRAVTPFSNVEYRAFAPFGKGALVIDIKAQFKEATPLTIRLEKWATPNFFHHYEQVSLKARRGLFDTNCEAFDGMVRVSHSARGCASSVVMEADGGEAKRISSHEGQLAFVSATEHSFTLYVASEVGADVDAAREKALNTLGEIKSSDPFPAHESAWAEYWNRSFVHIENDYLENLYYIYLYQLNCCSGGLYPPLFGGLWTWFGDSRNWGHFYHWNHQQTLWPVYAAGQFELAGNYLNFRSRMLKNARDDANRLYGAGGAFFSDIANLNGFNAIEPDTIRNLSVTAQIAMDFIKHFRYTMDEGFYGDLALSMVREAARFYIDMYELDTDGKYRVKGGETAYESYWNLRETLSGLSEVMSLFRAALELGALEGEEADRCREILDNLPDWPTEEILHEGEKLTIFAAGCKWSGDAVSYGEGEYPFSPFPATLISPVWPSRLVGLDDAGSREFDIARNTARVLFDREVYQSGVLGLCSHAPTPELAACLGMEADCNKVMERFVQAYQVFPNGLCHFAEIAKAQQWSKWDRPRLLGEGDTQWAEVHEKSRGERAAISSEYFLHSYFEASANIACGLQQSLLQSKSGVIRLFPACNTSAVFRLWAEGGFIINAERDSERVLVVAVESLYGGLCRIINPWPGEEIAPVEGLSLKGDLIEIECEAGVVYQIYPAEFPIDIYYSNDFPSVVNPGPKRRNGAMIGLDRTYYMCDERGL